MKEVRDKERRLTETKSTARRSGRGGCAAGVGRRRRRRREAGERTRSGAGESNFSHSPIYRAEHGIRPGVAFHLFSSPV